MDYRIENLMLPVNVTQRETILKTPVPEWQQGGDWQANWERNRILREKEQALQYQEVIDKREALAQLSEKLATFKKNVESEWDDLCNFVRSNDLEDMVDFDVYSQDFYVAMETSDVIADALKWAASDHSC